MPVTITESLAEIKLINKKVSGKLKVEVLNAETRMLKVA